MASLGFEKNNATYYCILESISNTKPFDYEMFMKYNNNMIKEKIVPTPSIFFKQIRAHKKAGKSQN